MAKKFLLVDDEVVVDVFDSEEDLEEYLEEEEYSENHVEDLQVFSFDKEYRVTTSGYELEEV